MSAPATLQVSVGANIDSLQDGKPQQVADKLWLFDREAKDRHAALTAVSVDLSEVRQEEIFAGQRERELLGNINVRMGGGEDHPSVVANRKKRELISAKKSRLQQVYDERSERWREVAGPLSEFERYFDDHRGKVFKLASPTTVPKLEKGETFVDGVARCRASVEALKDEEQRTKDANLPAALAIEKMIAQVNAAAERGKPNVLELLEGRQKFSFRRGYYEPSLKQQPIDAEALICWLHKDALIAALKDEIAASADESSALDDATMAKKLQQIRAQRIAVEREEEALIEAAHAQGIAIARRRDADPRAVFGLSDDAPAPRS
jgi:hypothetical protein